MSAGLDSRYRETIDMGPSLLERISEADVCTADDVKEQRRRLRKFQSWLCSAGDSLGASEELRGKSAVCRCRRRVLPIVVDLRGTRVLALFGPGAKVGDMEIPPLEARLCVY